jgi:hypothetical protein
MPVMIRDKKTGEVTEREMVDAREILARSGDLYELVELETGPQNVNMLEEFKREPVGADVPRPRTDEDEVVKIRNPISDQPRMAMPPGVESTNPGTRGAAEDRNVVKDQLESMTVAELKETAANEEIDLSGATVKAEIVKTMLREKMKRAQPQE